jgi:hypothetical protein
MDKLGLMGLCFFFLVSLALFSKQHTQKKPLKGEWIHGTSSSSRMKDYHGCVVCFCLALYAPPPQ